MEATVRLKVTATEASAQRDETVSGSCAVRGSWQQSAPVFERTCGSLPRGKVGNPADGQWVVKQRTRRTRRTAKERTRFEDRKKMSIKVRARSSAGQKFMPNTCSA